MDLQEVFKVENYVFKKDEENHLPPSVVHNLYQFISQHHHIVDSLEFHNHVINTNKAGEISVTYAEPGIISGFFRTFIEQITHENKTITIFLGYLFTHPMYNHHAQVDYMGLKQAMDYQRNHPNEHCAYIAYANNPKSYAYIHRLSPMIYPRPHSQTPNMVLKLLAHVKEQLELDDIGQSLLKTRSPLRPFRSQYLDFYQNETCLDEFYLKINPDYVQGESILVYLPLSLLCIEQVLAQEAVKVLPQKSSYLEFLPLAFAS